MAASFGDSAGPERHRKRAVRAPWFLTLFDLMLLALIIVLGMHTLQKAGSVGFAPVAEAAIETDPLEAASVRHPVTRPLSTYRAIWQRDLFKTNIKKQPEPKEEISVEDLAPAAKNLGLKLLGTVVVNNPAMSRAIIDNRSTRKQEIYREGDRAGKVRVKKILPNKVVITTKKGDELLAVDSEENRNGSKSIASRRRATEGDSSSPLRRFKRQSPLTQTRNIQLKRNEVEESLSDLDQVIEELNVSPFEQDGEPAGFQLTNIATGSILAKMGLRNGYVITGVDDEIITFPDQAAEFLQRLKEGGDINIKVGRSSGARRRSQTIHLKIE
jgi:type II secretion system protein C